MTNDHQKSHIRSSVMQDTMETNPTDICVRKIAKQSRVPMPICLWSSTATTALTTNTMIMGNKLREDLQCQTISRKQIRHKSVMKTVKHSRVPTCLSSSSTLLMIGTGINESKRRISFVNNSLRQHISDDEDSQTLSSSDLSFVKFNRLDEVNGSK